MKNITILLTFLIVFGLILPTKAQESRPSYNTGTGFFVKNGRIYDANGQEFIAMGANAAVYWGNSGSSTCKLDALSIHMPNAGANAVRIVTVTPPEINPDNSWSWNASYSRHREMVERAVTGELVPILEMHDATCGNNKFQEIIDYWTDPQTVQLCKDYEEYLIINFANEHNFSSVTAWKNAYISLIQDIRNLGVKNPVLIDSHSQCGQNPEGIKQAWQEILNADPEKNVIFSIHMYAFWRTNDDDADVGTWPNGPWSFEAELAWFRNNNVPLIVGEFGWHTPTFNQVTYRGDKVIDVCAANGYGWTFWAWNNNNDSKHYYGVVRNGCDDGSPGTRNPAGDYIIPYWQANAQKASIFSSGGVTPTYSLTVQATNGSVSKSPNQSQYDQGTQVTLTATPDSGFEFTGWSGDASGTSNPLVITMNSNKNVTANFSTLAPNQYTLNTSTVGQGSITLSPSGGTYDDGTVVSATAVPASGWQFDGWSGAASGTTNPASITMDANKTLTATFSEIPTSGGESFTIQAENFTANSGGMTGTNHANYTGTGYFDMAGNNSWVEYIFNANGGAYTLDINYANGSTGNRAANVIINGGTPIAENFAPTGSWSTWNDASFNINLNAGSNTIRIQVTTNAGGPNIDRLELDGGSGGAPPTQYTLTTSTVGQGSITLNPSGGTYDAGMMVTATAVPASGWQFDGWSGASTSTNASVNIMMDANKSLTATFSQVPVNQYTLTTSTVGQGSITLSPSGGTYDAGMMVTATAVPASGWQFDGWSGASTSTNASVNIMMDANKSLTATFSEIPTGGGGTSSYRYWRFTVTGAVNNSFVALDAIDLMDGSMAQNMSGWKRFDPFPDSFVKDFGSVITADAIRLDVVWTVNRAPSGFTLEGSNDNSNWTTVLSESGLTASDYNGANAMTTFPFGSAANFNLFTQQDRNIQRHNYIDEIVLYPNSANHYLNLKNVEKNSEFKIIDSQGKVYAPSFDSANQSKIDISNLEAGFYFLQIMKDDKQIIKRFLIKK